FFNDPQTTALYTLSLHDALPIFGYQELGRGSLAVPLLAVTERALPLVDELARLGIPCLCERRSDARADEDEHDERDEREAARGRSEEHTSELQSRSDLVCRLLLE